MEKVNPDLVVRDKEGKPYSVRYDQVNAMLLNEFLKEHREVQEQKATITQLKSSAAKQEAIAAQQQKGYPDIKSLIVTTPPAETVQRAIDAARASGWEIVASDAPAGRIEATDTTRWFGFKDDIVVRVRPEGPGSRIDVRSVSRVGKSDVGANAKRVREFLSRLA